MSSSFQFSSDLWFWRFEANWDFKNFWPQIGRCHKLVVTKWFAPYLTLSARVWREGQKVEGQVKKPGGLLPSRLVAH
jgi:hypothetical protein